jgi:hypothetical protein
MKYYIIECGLNEIEFALILTDALKQQGHQYVISAVAHMPAISMKQVTKEQFNEFNKN